ncbi:MAG TPA: septal ring lytic transglycosylase RlpA family protein [Terriglobales bacterium]|nr:septal ring lytic transglycosylase RlpA family protein [Terriglobales bacterium]
MYKRLAHGMAIVLSVVTLVMAQGPTAESRQTQGNVSKQAVATFNRKLNRKRPYQVGTASWYGKDFQGKATASGEPFNMYDLTAAHPTLPLGTTVRVTNLRNGRTVLLRINDRGPVPQDRIIDVSYSAARALGFKGRGLQRVRLDVVEPQMMAMLRTPQVGN